MPDKRRPRGEKSSYEQSLRNFDEQLESLAEQLDEMEARRIMQDHIEDQHAIQQRLRRKMH